MADAVTETAAQEIGRARRRVEDEPLLRGAGRFVDDLVGSDALHVAFVRSPYPHARVRSIDSGEALAAPGVVAVLTARDLPAAPAPVPPTPFEFKAMPPPLLVGDVAHYVGAPVALVVARSPAQAVDAAAQVAVDWEPLPAVSAAERAVEAGAPLVHPELGTNVAFTTRRGTAESDLAARFAGASHVVREHLVIPRLAGVPLQPMAILAVPEPAGDGIGVWCTTQTPWRVHAALARTLGLPEARVRVVAPDVGGGFGVRGPVYPEYLAVALAARRLGQPVTWTATRSEDMLATRGARDVVADAEMAADRDGRIVAIRARVLVNLGAYADSLAAALRILQYLVGPYAAEAAGLELRGVYTNTTPTGPYRGAGRPESTYIVERLVESLARRTGIDPAELRRRNFIPPDRFPYKTPLGATYDSGSYAAALGRALDLSDYRGARARQAELAVKGSSTRLGIGIAAYVEPTSAGWESGRVRVEPSGRVTADVGSSAQGQGHRTALAQIVADRLGVPFEDVAVRQGDTAAGPPGIGTFGSRSTTLGGGALDEAATRVLAKAREIAAHLLEVAPEDVVPTAGGLAVAGAPGRRVAWARLAQVAWGMAPPPGIEPGLEATTYFRLAEDPFSFGVCVAQVAVDTETGEVTVERMVSVDDCGTVVNPLLLAGQSHGGLAQGIGATLSEWMRYDEEGQPLTGTLLDYALPLARDLPGFELDHTTTPSPWNRLGIKGHAEAGAIAAPPAVLGAVLDALAPLGVRAIDPPLTPERVWSAIRAARAANG